MTESTFLSEFKQIVRRNNFVVLDTETTGLESNAEVCQIAILESDGTVLLDTLVKPVNGIPADAEAIHHISNQMVASAPRWADVHPMVYDLLKGRDCIIYNAVYDRRILHQSAEAAGLPKTNWKQEANIACAMLAFAEVYGDWNSYRGNYKWQSLSTAARYYRLPVIDAHSALGDCRMTLGVVKAMVAVR